MSWASIAAALQTRINAVCTAAPTKAVVHPYLRWSSDGVEGDDYQAKFVTVQDRLATCQITRTAVRYVRAAQDSRRRVQHDVKAELTLALEDADQTELLHQALIDLICEDLATGDRTLGGIAKTHQEPRVENIQVARFGSVTSHSCELLFTVEEVLGTRPTPSLDALADLGAGITSGQLEISIALIEWLASQSLITGLGLVQLQLEPSMRPHPIYPVDPVADLPALLLVNHTDQNTRQVGNQVDSIYQASLYYYRRQTPGENHQQKLLAAARAIETLLLRNPRPPFAESIRCDMQTPGKVEYPDELLHPLTDDPRLRVSVAELVLQIQSKR